MCKKILPLWALFLCFSLSLIANDYEQAWKALHKNDRATARKHLLKAISDPQTKLDSYLTYIYLQTFDGQEDEITDFYDAFVSRVENADPYLFALWFNHAVVGEYGKKTGAHQLKLIDKILSSSNFNGATKAAARYGKATNYLFGAEFDKIRKEYEAMGSVNKWQFTGPFDNLSGSGFNKQHGPLSNALPDAVFTGINDASVQWIKPAAIANEGWTLPFAHFRKNTAVVYGQAFVYSPSDKKIYINAGCSGNLKVWVNDALVISEERERVTELDAYRNQVELKKGFNRLLVQLGYVDNSFPNYIIRFTDENYNSVTDLTYTDEYKSYPKAERSATSVSSMEHFAEAFFKKKIQQQPENIINYLLLSQTYLRNKKVIESRSLLEKALQKFPDNSLLRFELILCLLKDSNRTLLVQEIERMKEKDPDCAFTLGMNISRLMEEQNWEETLQEIEKIETRYGRDASTAHQRIQVYAQQEKLEELIKLLEESYEKYPTEPAFVRMTYNLAKMSQKNPAAAIKVLEKYIKSNYNFELYTLLRKDYIQQNQQEKGLKMLTQLAEIFPYDPDVPAEIAKHYYETSNYKKALEYYHHTVKLAPYSAQFWHNIGMVNEQLSNQKEAIEAYRKALYFDMNRFGTREKLRDLENKKNVFKVFPETDVYELIRKNTANADYNFQFLLDEKNTVIYPEGATEQSVQTVVRINNQKGIDSWKEYSVPYSSGTEDLFIDKAEVVKKNGSKIPAEKNGADIVFTGLAEGDVIVLKYRTQYFTTGRFAKEFWERFTFDAFMPCDISRYSLLIAKNIPFEHTLTNGNLKPSVSDVEDFKLYTWEMKNVPILKEEPLMPPMTDVGMLLHFSTIRNWDVIAKWYQDLVTQTLAEDYVIDEAFKSLFSEGIKGTEYQKARKIYDYLMKNISYSSVPFRQNAFRPQIPSKTLETRLGDCKDLSALFIALAKKAGIKANLVLVNTRNNGAKDIMLPSMSFNHCIVKAVLDKKEYFIELTDAYLPFGSLPYNLYGASSLLIPAENEVLKAELKPIIGVNRTKDRVSRRVHAKVEGSDLRLSIVALKSGALSASVRDQYASLTPEKQKEEMESSVTSGNSKQIKMHDVKFDGLSNLTDSAIYEYSYTIKEELSDVGEMQMVKIPYIDVVASIDNFSQESRNFPIEYWSYENADEYETVVELEVPKEKQIIEVPKDQQYSFGKSSYSVRFVKQGTNKLQVIRKAVLNRNNIEPKDYPAFREFFNNIVKVESKYILIK